ncbi:DNA-binding beta-propeller fold protein YncE [Methylobacter tundripaludum]|uniref:DNA-binding beta-propeller fold protein YncE n=2 Tax=Methylobacter tundripaludum TaxID=173365 RepID=A0A2S6H8B1_9GAMM|nr:DNA-binding beta-propeller fold protein YncE [Methylobacter tundripaludum]
MRLNPPADLTAFSKVIRETTMTTKNTIKFARSLLVCTALLSPVLGYAEILAMVNYESKPGQTPRREGIAIIDVDPASKNFAKILNDIPLPDDLVAHHIFYNKDLSKAYITSLGNGALHVMDMTHVPYRPKKVDMPDCKVAEDVAFSKDNKTWYMTCMGSSNVIVGDAQTDKQIKVIAADSENAFIRYPHGISINEDIDRIMVTSTVRPSDLGDPGETVTVIEASSGNVLSSHKLSDKPSPSGVSPVEAVFLPGSNPPTAYINTMFGGALWTGTWNAGNKNFDFQQVFDFNAVKQGVPLEIYFNDENDRMYITTANPGYLNIFDISQSKQKPTLIKAIPTAGGAHHVVLSPDEQYAVVQNSFLNLPDMSDGSITVIDLNKMEVKATIDTFKKQGLNPNCIIMMPKWHHDTAH